MEEIRWMKMDYPNFGGDNYYSGLVITSDGIVQNKGHNGYDPSFIMVVLMVKEIYRFSNWLR